jgi:hypothetical protein
MKLHGLCFAFCRFSLMPPLNGGVAWPVRLGQAGHTGVPDEQPGHSIRHFVFLLKRSARMTVQASAKVGPLHGITLSHSLPVFTGNASLKAT